MLWYYTRAVEETKRREVYVCSQATVDAGTVIYYFRFFTGDGSLCLEKVGRICPGVQIPTH